MKFKHKIKSKMSHKPLSVEKILKIKEKLPRGSQVVIARTTGLSVTTVCEVLNGDHYNYEVIESALNILEAQCKKGSNHIKRAEKLLKD